MTAVRIEPQPESYESTLTTRHLHLPCDCQSETEKCAASCCLSLPAPCSSTTWTLQLLSWGYGVTDPVRESGLLCLRSN